ncbi:hypothetical protein PA01_00290 [Azoarcus sp. PA01]|nr:hypothetical protein PA01_19540 [Azoarcus sp. PA01]KON82524.1 hypothetical protein PA01_00290 [Azoarcus sp. PA01]
MSATDDNQNWQLIVGQPFIPGVTRWLGNRFEYRIFCGTHLLQICLANLAARDIKAFHPGSVPLGLCQLNHTLFVLFRVAGILDWSDQAYFHRLVTDPEDRELPPHMPGTYQALSLVLVKSETGLVRGLRVVSWSGHASAVFDRLLREQLEGPFDPAEHARRVQEVYARCRTSEDLMRTALLTERAGCNL